MTHVPSEVLRRALELVEPRAPQQVPLVEAVGQVLARDEAGSNGVSFKRGARVSATLVEQLARQGRESVAVVARPCLAVITIGDDDEQGVVGLTLNALAREVGIVDTHHFQADAVLEDVAFVLDHVARADLVLFTGGGADLGVQGVTHHGATVLFHGTLGEGRPLLVATLGPQMIFGLPAGARAARACFEEIVVPVARRMRGQIDPIDADAAQIVSAPSA